MQKIVLSFGVGVLLLLASATNGWALITPYDSGEPIQIYTAINGIFSNVGISSSLTTNADANIYQITPDEYWQNLAGQSGGEVAAISVGAGWQNALGVFLQGNSGSVNYILPPVGNAQQFLGDGSSSNPYPGGVIPISDPEQYFGFSIETTDIGDPSTPISHWYSDPSLNGDVLDHMLTYQLAGLDGKTIYLDTGKESPEPFLLTGNTYLIAWEDLPQDRSDLDYNDATFLVAKVRPVPEPASLLLLGSGLVGLLRLRKKNN